MNWELQRIRTCRAASSQVKLNENNIINKKKSHHTFYEAFGTSALWITLCDPWGLYNDILNTMGFKFFFIYLFRRQSFSSWLLHPFRKGLTNTTYFQPLLGNFIFNVILYYFRIKSFEKILINLESTLLIWRHGQWPIQTEKDWQTQLIFFHFWVPIYYN